jgi:SAM-dependent methyltransferase
MKNRSENLLEYGPAEASARYTHYLFRYPAKFHPPVARALLERHTSPGERVLDCFCGSGTLLVEAALTGRSAIGSDVDPIAAFVSRVKATPLDVGRLRKRWAQLEKRLEPLARSGADYDDLQWQDIDASEYETQTSDLAVPAIPNLFHWFRRYVIVDLARLKKEGDRRTRCDAKCALRCASVSGMSLDESPSRPEIGGAPIPVVLVVVVRLRTNLAERRPVRRGQPSRRRGRALARLRVRGTERCSQ